MSSVLTRPEGTARPASREARSGRAAALLPALLGALVGVCAVKAALLTGATAGLEARLGWYLVAWGGKVAGLAAGAALGWLAGRAWRRRAADL